MRNHTYTIGELCTITKGITGIQKAITGKYPLVVTSEERKSHNEYQFDDEAVIVPLVSGTGHGHASIKRIHYQTGKFALGSILCAIIPKDKSILNSAYLFRYLNLNKDNELVARMKGMANVTLPIKEIAKIEIPLPSLAEQLEFVKKYTLLEADSQLIELEFQQQLSLVKQLRQVFLSEAIQGKLCLSKSVEDRETGSQLLKRIKAEKEQFIKDRKLRKEKELPHIKQEEIPFEIPENWIWCRLGAITNFIDYRGKTPNKISSGIKLITAKNVKFGTFSSQPHEFISQDDYDLHMTRGIPKNGDILFTTEAPLGNACLLNYHEKFALAQRIITIQPIHLINKFLLYVFLSPEFQHQLRTKQSGATAKGIKSSRLVEVLIPLPSLSIQNQIVLKLDQLMNVCDDLGDSIQQSQIQNEQLLQQVSKEALEVKEKPAQSVKLSIPENRRNFAKQVLGGKIISMFKDDPNFTHIKFQKLQYLSEHIAEADLGSDYYFQTAGPYDNKFMHSIAISLERSKWFKEENYRYYPLEKVDQIDQYYDGYFAPANEKLNNLFNLLANATDTFSEIIATLYAVWNNRIIKKEELGDNLLIQDFYNWSDRKQQYTKEQLVEGIEFIRVNHIEPTGFGKELKRAKGK